MGAGLFALALVVAAVWLQAPILWAASLAMTVGALVHASFRSWSQNSALLRSELNWLGSLPFDWNRAAYEDILSTRQRFVELRINVRFANFETYRSTTVRDLATAFGDLIVETQDSDSISIRSPILRGYHGGSGGPFQRTDFDNQLIHTWFRTVVDHVVLRLHQQHSIESLTVTDVTPVN